MSAVTLQATALRALRPASDSAGTRLCIELDMTRAQARAAVIELLGRHVGNEQEAAEWLQYEFPELCGVPA